MKRARILSKRSKKPFKLFLRRKGFSSRNLPPLLIPFHPLNRLSDLPFSLLHSSCHYPRLPPRQRQQTGRGSFKGKQKGRVKEREEEGEEKRGDVMILRLSLFWRRGEKIDVTPFSRFFLFPFPFPFPFLLSLSSFPFPSFPFPPFNPFGFCCLLSPFDPSCFLLLLSPPLPHPLSLYFFETPPAP